MYPGARTKVIATLGPASDGREGELIAAGVSAVRINCSHSNRKEWQTRVEAARKAAEKAGRPVAVLVDLCGPKIRLAETTKTRQVKKDERLRFSHQAGDGIIGVDWSKLADAATPGLSEIVIGDGSPRLLVEGVVGDVVSARALTGGKIGSRMGLTLTHASHDAPALTRRDLEDLEFAAAVDADFIALSFVRSKADIELLQMAIRLRDFNARTIAKIEKAEAVDNIEEIVAVADGIMIARGDLGVEIGVAQVPLAQKKVIDAGRDAGKMTVVATQMLESMLSSGLPTRAEATDIANAVLDGTSAVMLSGETAIGDNPVEAVEAMIDIAAVAEGGNMRAWAVGGEDTEAAAVMQSAVLLARNLSAEAIIAVTGSGGAARAAAKYRPRRPLIALTENERVARQLALEWGVMPAVIERDKDIELFHAQALKKAGQIADVSGPVVMTHGPRGDRVGTTNLITIAEIENEDV